jgi:hypothetical protein
MRPAVKGLRNSYIKAPLISFFTPRIRCTCASLFPRYSSARLIPAVFRRPPVLCKSTEQVYAAIPGLAFIPESFLSPTVLKASPSVRYRVFVTLTPTVAHTATQASIAFPCSLVVATTPGRRVSRSRVHSCRRSLRERPLPLGSVTPPGLIVAPASCVAS